MAQSRVAVVGGGLAGLAAAVELKRRGHHVELFERSRLLGGKATSFEVDGIEVDNGQHVFLACCTEFIQFVEELCKSNATTAAAESPLYIQPRFEALLLSQSHAPVHLRSVNLPAPLHLSIALMRSCQLGIAGRLQVATALLLMRDGQLPGETFAHWLNRYRQGRGTWEGFWEPFLVPALNARLEDVSAQEAAFVLKTAFLQDPSASRFGYSRVPLGRLANLAVPLLDKVHLRTPVIGLDREGNDSNRIGLRLRGGGIMPFDGVVLAVTPDRLGSLLGRSKELGVFGLSQFTYAPIVDVHLWFDLPPNTVLGKGAAFAALLNSPIQWVFDKPAPPGETYLCCSMSAAHTYVSTSSQELIALAQRELATVLPAIRSAKLLRGAATRDREATFVSTVGLVRPGPHTASRRVTVAGSWTDTGWPATMESAIRSGRRAAEVLHGAIA